MVETMVLSYLTEVAYRTMPAGLPPLRWQGRSQPVSRLLLLTWMPEAGSLAADTHDGMTCLQGTLVSEVQTGP